MPIRRNFRFADIKGKLASPATMRTVGLNIAVHIVRRTMSGIDEQGRRFVPYAKSTKRRKLSYGSGAVDLFESGDMLNDIGVTKVTAKSVRVGFSSKEMEQRARHHEEGHGNLPVRRFMGVSHAWVLEAVKTIQRGLRLKT